MTRWYTVLFIHKKNLINKKSQYNDSNPTKAYCKQRFKTAKTSKVPQLQLHNLIYLAIYSDAKHSLASWSHYIDIKKKIIERLIQLDF